MDFTRRTKFPFNPMRNKKMTIASFLFWTFIIYKIYSALARQELVKTSTEPMVIDAHNIKSLKEIRSDKGVIKIAPVKHVPMDASRMTTPLPTTTSSKQKDTKLVETKDRPKTIVGAMLDKFGINHVLNRFGFNIPQPIEKPMAINTSHINATEHLYIKKVKVSNIIRSVQKESNFSAISNQKVNQTDYHIINPVKMLDSLKLLTYISDRITIANFSFGKIKRKNDSALMTSVNNHRSLEKLRKERELWREKAKASETIGLCRCEASTGLCKCCSQLKVEFFGFNKSSCVILLFNATTMTFTSKFEVDGIRIYEKKFQAKKKADICVADNHHVKLCLVMNNLTYTVVKDKGHDRLTSVRGCIFWYMKLLKKTIGVYPLQCFRMNTPRTR